MKRLIPFAFIFFTTASLIADELSPADWPWWRGPSRNGIAAAGQSPPVEFGDSKNVVWATPITGRGHGSATVVGTRVFLAIADEAEQTQSLMCLNRDSGKELWRCELHRGGLPEKMNQKATNASSTPACDGKQVYISFMNSGAVHASAVSLDGRKLWQTKVTDYVIHQGYGTSPALYKDTVIVSADNKLGGAICAMNTADGKIAWKVDRPKKPNYASPILLRAAGKEQLLFSGCDLVTSLNPMTGEKLWETDGATTECVTSVVTDGTRVFVSGGYPKNHVAAYLADGSGTKVWENTARVYVPSMIVQDGYLYATMDAGFAVCWKSDTGQEMWKGRLGGDLKASPTLANGLIYSPNDQGELFVFKATPSAFEPVATNKLGDEILSTPTICGSRIYLRVAAMIDGKRSEKLYCFGL